MKSDAQFCSDWAGSHGAVLTVALWLSSKGYDVRMPIPTLRANVRDRWKHSDSGDIEVTQRIEVKRRNLDFTSQYDYPYPTVYVDEKYKVDERLGSVLGWIILNREATHIAMILKGSREHWLVTSRRDAHQDRECTWYACPVAHVAFHSLNPRREEVRQYE